MICVKFDATKTALIVVDMQRCFCKPSGSLFSKRSQEVIPNIQSFLERARKKDLLIVYTKDAHQKVPSTTHYNEFERWGAHCVKGTEEAKIVSELEPREKDVIIEKDTYDAFHNTSLNEILNRKEIESVLVTGVLTNVCVLHTASSAALNDYQTTVISDCTAALNDYHKEYALKHVDFLFGQVVESSDIEFDA